VERNKTDPSLPSGEPAKPAEPAPASPAGGEPPARPREIGGPAGPEPTRYRDWERRGRCIDF